MRERIKKNKTEIYGLYRRAHASEVSEHANGTEHMHIPNWSEVKFIDRQRGYPYMTSSQQHQQRQRV